ncbi:MAG TPA: hypothetical protein VFR67_09540 [Pilimelia sp.]|nr:hypothetical protein [Pilimelia sp.]
MAQPEMYCAICEADMVFDAPPCPDGHGLECPELLCTGCGTAVFGAPVVLRAWLPPTPSGTTPHHRRHAA